MLKTNIKVNSEEGIVLNELEDIFNERVEVKQVIKAKDGQFSIVEDSEVVEEMMSILNMIDANLEIEKDKEAMKAVKNLEVVLENILGQIRTIEEIKSC